MGSTEGLSGPATSSPGRPNGDLRPAVWIFVSMAGLSAAITILFLSMRAVMRVGGQCASGGPYVIATPCPKGIPLLMIGSIWGGLAFLFASIVQSARTSVPNLAPLAWPALFLALGYNFLAYGIDPPGDTKGPVWSWVICAILFAVIGGGPVVLAVLWARSPAARRVTLAPVMGAESAARLLRARGAPPPASPWWPSTEATTSAAPGSVEPAAGSRPEPDDLVSKLERVADLHRRGDISDAEFQSAKDALLRGGGA